MTAFYDNLAATALSLLETYGKSVSIRTYTDTFPSKPYTPSRAASDETAQAVEESYSSHDLDGTTVRVGDKRYLVAASDLTTAPTTAALLVDGSVAYEIVRVDAVQPGGTPVIYVLQCRASGE